MTAAMPATWWHMLRAGLLALVAGLLLGGARDGARIDDAAIMAVQPPALLSSYGFFAGRADRPVAALIPYNLETPLFSDYADKSRFIYLPAGAHLAADGDGMLIFPVGSVIIKNFSFRMADGSERTVETRLLIHQAGGWVALPYIWRADGSDADLRLAGGRFTVDFVHDGQGRQVSYAVPNRNQCRTCHQRNEVLEPIGPKWINLVPDARLAAAIGGADLLRRTRAMPRWDDAAAPIDARARAYLDGNCAHCHNPAGSASNSGLFLEYDRPMGFATGLWKRPTAAGRGSGGMEYAINPGQPDQSFLLYRLQSREPGVEMPELGRNIVHAEGVRLIRDWIGAMHGGEAPRAGQ